MYGKAMIDGVFEMARRKGLTRAELCRRAGVSDSMAARSRSPNKAMQLGTLLRLLDAAGIDARAWARHVDRTVAQARARLDQEAGSSAAHGGP